MENEIYKDIPTFNGIYKVSNLGNVMSFKNINKPKLLRPGTKKNGYMYVILTNNNIKKSYNIHTLVAMSYLGFIPSGYGNVVNHIDNNKSNNSLRNLEVTNQRKNLHQHFNSIEHSSKYIGVQKYNGKYRTFILIDRVNIHIGVFDSEIEAHNAYQLSLTNKDKFNGNKKQFRTYIKSLIS